MNVYVLKGDTEFWGYAMFGVFSSEEDALYASQQIWELGKNYPNYPEDCEDVMVDGWTGLTMYELPTDAFYLTKDGYNSNAVERPIFLNDVEALKELPIKGEY